MTSVQATWQNVLRASQTSESSVASSASTASSSCSCDGFRCSHCSREIAPSCDVFMGFDLPYCSSYCRTTNLTAKLTSDSREPVREPVREPGAQE